MLAAEKQELRGRMTAARELVTPGGCAEASRRAAAHLAQVPGLLGPHRMVGLYAALPDSRELATADVEEALRVQGVRVAYPRLVRGSRVLAFHAVWAADLAPSGRFGLREPLPTAPTVPLDEIDTFIVPGLAFARSGERLGWGQGYYDTTLAAAPRALRVGFAFQLQVVAAVPADVRDQVMDWLVTEEGASPTGGRRLP